MLRRLSAIVLLGALASCGPRVTFRKSAGAFPSRAEGCAYRVFEGWTARPYFVLGRLDIDAFHSGRLPRDEAALRAVLDETVCRAGGDGVLATRDVTGRYRHATVVSFLAAFPEPDE